MLLLGFAFCQKIGAAFFVLVDPFLRKAAVANFSKQLFHFLAGLLRNDAWAGGVIAVLGGVADGIAHVAQAAAVDEVDDQL